MTKRPTSPRLADVAKAAGVSLASASRAMSADATVGDGTRMRVRAAALAMGYVPHGAARALASRRTRTIGAVFPPLDNPIFASGTNALARALADAGYTLLLASHDYDLSAETRAARALIERGVDGLVLVGNDHEPALMAMLAQAGIPFEITWMTDPSQRQHAVGLDHRVASMRVTRHLLDLGHREFAVVTGPVHANDRARDRYSGVRDTLETASVPLPAERVVQGDFSIAAGRRSLERLLAQAPGFTALICSNDVQAIGALLECAARSIRVPTDLSVAGFDDIELASEMRPTLTTVRVPSAEIGRRAGERLLARLAGQPVERSERLPAPLIERESTGVAASGPRPSKDAGAPDSDRALPHAVVDAEPAR
jgi:LacI family transcriptional regulator